MVKNASTLPNLEYKTDERLNYFQINKNDILSVINNLNASRAHEWDKISIRMIKLCSKTIAIQLKLIFRSMLEEGVFPDDWKKAMYFQSTKETLKTWLKIIDQSDFFLFSVKFLKGLYLIPCPIIL